MLNSDDYEDYDIKVILLGNAGVGKTNLINISLGNKFNEEEQTTTSASFFAKELEINNQKCIVNLWDTIGQEKYRYLTKIFFNKSKIAIFVYDITNRESFEQLPIWIKDVEDQLGPDIVKGVIANKMDLFFNEKVTEEEGQKLAESIKAEFLSTSAKVDGPKKFDDFLIKLVLEYISKEKESEKGGFNLNRENAKEETKTKGCCK